MTQQKSDRNVSAKKKQLHRRTNPELLFVSVTISDESGRLRFW